jgi:DNA-binding transcriptional MerR regulator
MQNILQPISIESVPTQDGSYFKTIGEVSAELKISPHVLRFWESKFQIIKPHKRRGGHRYYSATDVTKIIEIKALLYDKGFTIKGAQKYLKSIDENNADEIGFELKEETYNNHMQSTLFEASKIFEVSQPEEQKTADLINFREKALSKIDKKLVLLFIKELESIKTILHD